MPIREEPSVEDHVTRLSEHADRLAFAATVEATGESCARDQEVRKIMVRSAELVRGASALGEQRNFVALGVLARTIVESLILLLWVEIREENALHQSKAGLAELTRVGRINLERGSLKIHNSETGEDATADFLKSDRLKGFPKSKKIGDLAKEAGVEDLYEIFYRFQSMAMHGHEFSTDDSDPGAAVIIDMQAVGAMSMAIGHAGLRWLLHRERTNNESLRMLLGIGRGTQ